MILNNLSVIGAIARHHSSDVINRDMIGYSIKKDFGPFTRKKFKEYAAATNDDVARYSPADAAAPPFFFSTGLYPMFKKIITHTELRLDLLRMVDGYQGLNCFGQIEKGDCISVEMLIDDIIESPAGEILKIITRGYRDGEILFEGETGFVVRRRRHCADKKNGIRIVDPLLSPAENHSGEKIKLFIQTRKGQEREYSKVSNDTNPVHTSSIFAKLAGLPGTIMHGVCVLAMCTNSLINNCAGKDNRKLRSVFGRFAYPVFAGDTLTLIGIRGKRGKFHEINFTLYSSEGEAVIKKGFLSYSE